MPKIDEKISVEKSKKFLCILNNDFLPVFIYAEKLKIHCNRGKFYLPKSYLTSSDGIRVGFMRVKIIYYCVFEQKRLFESVNLS